MPSYIAPRQYVETSTDFNTPDPRTRTPVLLHGCQMPWLLQHHNRLLARPNSRHLPRLLDRSLPAHRGEGAIDRGVFV